MPGTLVSDTVIYIAKLVPSVFCLDFGQIDSANKLSSTKLKRHKLLYAVEKYLAVAQQATIIMMNSKNKGNSFERKIANAFSKKFELAFNKTQSFRRNPDSGSFFGGLNETRIATHHEASAHFGDIIAPPEFKFTIECKHYKDPPPLAAFLAQNITQWDKWIAQAEADATKAKREFLLIIKYNRVPELVVTNSKAIAGIPYKGYTVVGLDTLLELPDSQFI